MNDADKRKIIDRYNQRFAEFGADIRTLASGTEERRQLRFGVLAEIGLTPGCSVLDLGCGFGDFYGHLSRRGLDCEYTGYDINPTLIEAARCKFPDGRFEVKDIQAEPFPAFDFVVSSSAFNLRTLPRLARCCRPTRGNRTSRRLVRCCSPIRGNRILP